MTLRAGESGFDREVLILPRVMHGQGSFEERTGRLRWVTRGRPHHDAFTVRSLGFCGLLFLFVVLNAMDAVTTVYGIHRLGWEAEANMILRGIGGRFGATGFLVYKTTIVGLVVTGLWFMHRGFSRAVEAARSPEPRRMFSLWLLAVEGAAVALVVLFAWAVVNNFRIVA